MTNQGYEDYYNAIFEFEYEKIIQDFILAYNNDDSGYLPNDIICEVRNAFCNKINNFFLVKVSADITQRDWYYENLVKEFKSRRKKSLKDQFFLKFFEKGISELKETVERNNFIVYLPEIYNANEKDTLKYIAMHNAHEKFNHIFPPSNNIKYNECGIQHIIDILRGIVVKTDAKNEISETITIKNNFDNVDIKKVINHFKVGLVEKKFLSEDELFSFLIAAFEQLTAPKVLFKLKNVSAKDKVMKVFYEYYKTLAGKPHGKQKMYAALLGEYFQGYNAKNVSTNFNK